MITAVINTLEPTANETAGKYKGVQLYWNTRWNEFRFTDAATGTTYLAGTRRSIERLADSVKPKGYRGGWLGLW